MKFYEVVTVSGMARLEPDTFNVWPSLVFRNESFLQHFLLYVIIHIIKQICRCLLHFRHSIVTFFQRKIRQLLLAFTCFQLAASKKSFSGTNIGFFIFIIIQNCCNLFKFLQVRRVNNSFSNFRLLLDESSVN